MTQNSSGSDTRDFFPGTDSRTPGRNAVVSWISAVVAEIGRRFGGVLHQIEEHLDQLILVGEHRRQRRVVFLDEADVAREAGLREPFDVIEHRVDVDRAARDRPVVAEHLHAIDQRDDAVGLVADQPGQRPVFGRRRLLEQLRRAANARQRILDLVRQHRRQRDDRARRAAVGQLPVHLVGNGAFLKHHHDVAGPLADGRDVKIDLPVAAIRGVPRSTLYSLTGEPEERTWSIKASKRAAERHQLFQRMPLQKLARRFRKTTPPPYWRPRSARRARPAAPGSATR